MKSILFVLMVAVSAVARADLRPVDLRCEYLTDPLGIDSPRPRLSWRLDSRERNQRQTAYQIIVSSDAVKSRGLRGDLWDTGRVSREETLLVPYGGLPLTSRMRCHWTVRVWDSQGNASAWSKPAVWEMGLLNPLDWQGKWIGATGDTDYHPAPHLRRDFRLNGAIKRARIYVCGLGYHDLWLNGKRVGDHQLDPGYTRFDRRALYVTHDVTQLLNRGKNALGAILGCGWFNVHTKAVWYFDKAPWRAAPKLLLNLVVEYADGRTETFATDTNWKTSEGPIRYDSIYGGEAYDARKELPGWDRPGFDDSKWNRAVEVAPPGGRLAAQQMPPIRVTETIKPVKVTEPKPGVFVFDMGQNFAGWAELHASGPAGTEVKMRYGERLKPDGTLDADGIAQHQIKTNPPQPFQTDRYTLKGGGEERWHARFTYYGFQYVEVTGFPGKPTLDSLRGLFLHTDVKPVSEFACSNDLLNRIWKNTRYSYLSNLMSIPTDCPHREKNGWTGDAHLAAEQGLFNFNSAAVYTKWINDLGDEQKPTGELPGIVPTGGWGYDWGNGPAWDSAFLLIPWYVYVYCGDSGPLKDHYEGHKRYVDYLTSRSHDGINELGLGDWVPWKTDTPVSVTSTGYYYRDALIVSKTAELLGQTEEAKKYRDLAESIHRAFNAKFYQPYPVIYANGSQTAMSCALYQGFVYPHARDIVVNRLVSDIERKDGHIDTGILGAKYVLNALTENGRSDVAYRIVAQKTAPGWGAWLEQGATTLWEQWNGNDSRNHIMFGDVSAWMFKALAGINPDPDHPGFKHFVIKPNVVGDLMSVKASYDSVRGRIASSWVKESAGIKLTVSIPAGTSATIYVPASSSDTVTESGNPAERAAGVKYLRSESGYAVYEVGSGDYLFMATK